MCHSSDIKKWASLVGGIHGTPGNPFRGHPVNEKNHTLASFEDNISTAGASATLSLAPWKVVWPGENKAGGGANSHSQDDSVLVPWELAARPMLQRLSFIL